MMGRVDIFPKACNGNAAALAFLHTLFSAADIADDLHDKDKPARVADVLRNMVSLYGNPFFRANADALSALMICGVMSWDVSNDLPGHPQRQYYADQLEQVLFYVAMLCGGYEHAKVIAMDWINQGVPHVG